MVFQEVERNEFLQIIADIIAVILAFFQPWVTPIGAWMVSWIGFLLAFFPDDNLTIYYVIFGILIISGIIVNTKWPGVEHHDIYAKEGVDGKTIEHVDQLEVDTSTEEEKADKDKKAHELFKKDED